MVYIYILKLKHGKYYVGKTNNPEFRLTDHLNDQGSAWTSRHEPLELVELHPNCDEFDEDKYTVRCMKKYGMENVRGGSFTQVILPADSRRTLTQMLRSAQDRCYTCGSKDHWANECPTIFTRKTQRSFYPYDSSDSDEFDDETCFRCGRFGHYAQYCYAKTDVNGYSLKY